VNTAHIQDPEGSNYFVRLVAFKWLMAGIGWWVDLPRLQRDKAYMDACLQRALTSDSALLQKRSVEMLGLRRGGSDAHGDAVMASGSVHR